jgi:aspartate/methionine/tyrosine aminotransferase
VIVPQRMPLRQIVVGMFFVEDAPTNFVRLCFAKKDATLDEAARRLVAARIALVG